MSAESNMCHFISIRPVILRELTYRSNRSRPQAPWAGREDWGWRAWRRGSGTRWPRSAWRRCACGEHWHSPWTLESWWTQRLKFISKLPRLFKPSKTDMAVGFYCTYGARESTFLYSIFLWLASPGPRWFWSDLGTSSAWKKSLWGN